MNIIIRPSFKRDAARVSHRDLLEALYEKISQIESAKGTFQITGTKLLRGYTNHYRILVKTEKHSFRIGAIIRSRTVWLVRFLPRKTIYQEFP